MSERIRHPHKDCSTGDETAFAAAAAAAAAALAVFVVFDAIENVLYFAESPERSN